MGGDVNYGKLVKSGNGGTAYTAVSKAVDLRVQIPFPVPNAAAGSVKELP